MGMSFKGSVIKEFPERRKAGSAISMFLVPKNGVRREGEAIASFVSSI